ncbi:Flp pilus assembly protein CpaB [Planctomicrobium sp. SH668]|uniref:Flp pilus assembly protein CpaB n=1 Tax=Planctomicrobium sp. SH668 TaxID=3448126 RepID=UPI003F5BAFB6
MKPKTLILTVVACACGLVAMLGVQQAMQGSQGPVRIETAKVLVALENIESGQKLTAENTTFKSHPIGSIPEDAVIRPEDFDLRAAKVPLMVGDVVRKSKLTEKGEWGKSVAIPVGMRVISIPVDETHTISGLLKAGDRVDVLVTYQGRAMGGAAISKTKTLLEYVEVFSIDNQTANKIEEKQDAGHAKNVALLLTPEQAGFVILAQRKGLLSLSWRRRGDDELAQTKDVDEKLMEELQGTVGLHESLDGSSVANVETRTGRHAKNNDDFDSEETSEAEKFLDSTATEASITNTTPAVPEVKPEYWGVQIYTGKESRVENFEIGKPLSGPVSLPETEHKPTQEKSAQEPVELSSAAH